MEEEKLLKKCSDITGYTYKIEGKEDYLAIIEDLLDKIEDLEEQYQDLEWDLRDNYRAIPLDDIDMYGG